MLFKTRNRAEASIVQGMLEENGVTAQILNKLDSSYLNFGDLELFVPKEQKEKAEELLKTLSEEIIASFKQRIIENEELVNDVQKTLDGGKYLQRYEVSN